MNTKTVFTLCISGVFCLFTFFIAVFIDSQREWKDFQKEFYRLEAAKVSGPAQKKQILNTPFAIKQLNIDRLKRYDRCTTCHLGVEKMKNTGEKQPYTYHPNHDQHPFQNFGCTVCHEGQGLATTLKAAHGPVKHWDKPLLPREFLEASCGKCHYPNDVPEAASLVQGRILFEENGCRGCHKLYGKGGVVGPDLSRIGSKDSHSFDFKHVEGEHTPQQWIYEHFKKPDRIAPDTAMKNIEFDDEESKLLTVYMLSLRGLDMPEEYIPARAPQAEPPQNGAQLYAMYCRACHSKNGKGSTALAQELLGQSEKPLEVMVPSLNNPDAQDAVSNEFIKYTITYGRPKTNMNAWGTETGGGLSSGEIDQLVDFVRTWKYPGADLLAVSAKRGQKQMGRIFYQAKCAACHGVDGEGGIGISLHSPSFLSIASDYFMARTIVNGRPNTAMPAWNQFGSQEISDLISYMRLWQENRNNLKETLKLVSAGFKNKHSSSFGETLFDANCKSCHGDSGQGDLGPSLSTPEFLTIVDNKYLYEAIAFGRTAAGMPAWKHFSNGDVAALINHIRAWQTGRQRVLAQKYTSGDWQIGRFLYNDMCSSCHGNYAEGSIGIQLKNPEFLQSSSNAMLQEWIAFGKTGTPMRGFGKGSHGIAELKDDQITDIITYIRYLENNSVPALRISPFGLPELGRLWYVSMCSSCHGDYGEGSSGPALSNSQFLQTASDGFLMATLALGRDGTEMRPVTKSPQSIHSLSTDKVNDIIAYIRSWASSSPFTGIINKLSAPADIDKGQQLYESNCAGCHGINGLPDKALTKGTNTGLVVAPTLNNQEFLKSATDGFIRATVIRGRLGTAMRPFGQGFSGVTDLSEDDINNIVAFIRNWAIQ